MKHDKNIRMVVPSPIQVWVWVWALCALGLSNSFAASSTIWPATAVPAVVDTGTSSSMEVGVKFRSDVAGTVTGIRFYKAAGNTGTHVGTLWTGAGSKLASVTFSGESASGWQQANFATPVSIQANTLYVVSYHAPKGHVSADLLDFLLDGRDNPPLHVPASWESGGNGVYAVNANVVFPNQSPLPANFWVDVVFQGPAVLRSMTLAPANPSAVAGGTQSFTATATYSDNSTRNVTGLATWTSSCSSVATIAADGVATAVAPGATIISAAYAGVRASTQLTVKSLPPVILTTSLPNGTVRAAYSATLTASNGVKPYCWSVASGGLPPGLSLSAGSGTIKGKPTAAGTFNFTVKLSDGSQPAQTATKAFSMVIAPAPPATSLWSSTAVPAIIDIGSTASVEVGVKFRSDVAGTITGIRFYKAAANTGTHVGTLWTATGTKLASVTFTSESASGWQQANFATPVPIQANTLYVASYHASKGHFSANLLDFLVEGVDNPPLHAPSSRASGGNGVYALSSSTVFPNQSPLPINFWVDIVFAPTASAPTLKTIAVTPANPSIFAGAVQQFTATGTYSDGRVQDLTALATWSSSAPGIASVNGTGLATGLAAGSTTIAATLQNVAGSTTLQVQPAPVTVTPILVLTNADNAFSQYYAEILQTEGLNAFAQADVAALSTSLLAPYEVVLLGETPLSATAVNVLSNWVAGGGNLVAMRPDKKLAGLLGLTDAGTSLAEGYLLVNTSTGPGAGIVGQTIQYHGTADGYTPGGASSLATLYATAQTPTPNPAVTLRAVGANGGQAAAFTFDLARSVVYTRQGNPAWSGQERDGFSPIRPDDLFFGAASFDMQPDWVDFNKILIPQADEQQRLLANLIVYMEADRKLLPRFWYFPHGHEAALVMTGDDHANGGTSGRFDRYAALSAPGASVADWEAIRASSYVYPGAALSYDQAARYLEEGFEISMHLNTQCGDWNRDSLTAFFTQQMAQFQAAYPGLPINTHRIHCIAWSDFSTAAEVSRQFGIRLEVSYYYFPPSWVQDRPGLFTGSGMPMRFTTAQGSLLDIYQAPTQLTDESDQTYPYQVNALLDRALGPEGYYGAFVANMHTDSVDSPGSDAILVSALSRGVPIISAQQLLTWVDARNASTIRSLSWSNNRQRFVVQADPNAQGLLGMVPIPGGFRVTDLTYNNTPAPFELRLVKGIQYAFFSALSGNYEIGFTRDTVAPTIVATTPGAGAAGVSSFASLSITFSEAMAPASINSGTIRLRDAQGNPVAAALTYQPSSFTAVLTPNAPLGLGQTYTATVKGGSGGVTDLVTNALAADSVWTFTTTNRISLWSDTAVPTLITAFDTTDVELGLKFRSAVDGYVTGIRFFKGPSNTGAHVANLWTAAGVNLARADFLNETAEGWQYQAFATPVPITANTTYVASYHTAAGNYSADLGFFTTNSMTTYPLLAPMSTPDDGNGIFSYGFYSVFPSTSVNAANYWVDIQFQPAQP